MAPSALDSAVPSAEGVSADLAVYRHCEPSALGREPHDRLIVGDGHDFGRDVGTDTLLGVGVAKQSAERRLHLLLTLGNVARLGALLPRANWEPVEVGRRDAVPQLSCRVRRQVARRSESSGVRSARLRRVGRISGESTATVTCPPKTSPRIMRVLWRWSCPRRTRCGKVDSPKSRSSAS